MPGEYLWRRVIENDEDELQWWGVIMLVPIVVGAVRSEPSGEIQTCRHSLLANHRQSIISILDRISATHRGSCTWNKRRWLRTIGERFHHVVRSKFIAGWRSDGDSEDIAHTGFLTTLVVQVTSLNELLTSYPGFEGNVRQTLRADLLTNPKIRWPKRSASANTKP
jgi:hypothetical protein